MEEKNKKTKNMNKHQKVGYVKKSCITYRNVLPFIYLPKLAFQPRKDVIKTACERLITLHLPQETHSVHSLFAAF